MMQCKDIDDLMVEFLYQELEPDREKSFLAHKETCARCTAELGSLQQMRQALHSLPEAEPSTAVTSRLLHEAAKRAQREESGGILGWIARLLAPVMAHPGLAAAATLVLVGGAAGVLSMRGSVSEKAQSVPVESRGEAPAAAAAPAPAGAFEVTTDKPAATPPAQPVGGMDPAAKADDGSRPMVRPVDRPEPPADYVSKVPAPAVTAPTTKAAKAKTRAANDEGQAAGALGDADFALRGGRIGSESENALLKSGEVGEKKAVSPGAAGPVNRRDSVEGYASHDDVQAGGEEADKAEAKPFPKTEAEAGKKLADSPAPPPPPAPAKPSLRAPEPETASTLQHQAGEQAKNKDVKDEEQRQAPPRENEALASRKESASQAPAPKPTTSTPAKGQPDTAGAGTGSVADQRYGNAAPSAPAVASPPPPPAAEPAPAQAKLSEDARAQQQARPDADLKKAPPPEAPEQRLLREAQKAATAGNCADALTIGQRIAKSNPEFYKKRVAGDASLRDCQVAQERSRAKQPSRKQAPADRLEAPAEVQTTK